MTIKDLKPAAVFAIFDEINQVPRPSKKEGKIREYLLDFAAKHGLAVKTDAVGNTWIWCARATTRTSTSTIRPSRL